MIGIIGGTGLTKLSNIELKGSQWLDTPYGDPSSTIHYGCLAGRDIAFLARHGDPHQIPPHKINYRANLTALKQAGVDQIIAVNAVGGIHPSLGPAQISIPDQIIDYTYGREHTFYDGTDKALEHVDFTYPYTESLRLTLIEAAKARDIDVLDVGTYGATQGPRLESASEIKRLRQDGCDMVGMTGMPEAALARELDLSYACIALSVNWCAGMTGEIITMDEINQAIEDGMAKVHAVLEEAIERL